MVRQRNRRIWHSGMDSSVPLTQNDPRDLGLIYPGCQRFIFSFSFQARSAEAKKSLRVPQTAEFSLTRIIFSRLFSPIYLDNGPLEPG